MRKNNLKYSKNQLKTIIFKNQYQTIIHLQKMNMKNNLKNMSPLKKTFKLRKPYKIPKNYLFYYVPKKKTHFNSIQNSLRNPNNKIPK